MTVEIAEEDNSPARHCADLHVLRSPRLAAVDEGGLRDAPENSVELLLADMKCIVMHIKPSAAIIEVANVSVLLIRTGANGPIGPS